jgi:hypothetical protein
MKLVKEILYEKFTDDDSDPIRDMGIGSRTLIEKWIKKMNDISYKNYEIGINNYVINNDLTISAGETCSLPTNCGNFPKYIKFQEINGDFMINDCNMTTLRGCPDIVIGGFLCYGNKLTSLEYAPEIVHGTFNCENNKKQFTIKDVRKVCKVKGFICVV